MENPNTAAERWTLCFSSYKNCKLKLKLRWVGACERKKRAFFVPLILLCFISMYSVLNALSEYTYFYISNYITLYTFTACF